MSRLEKTLEKKSKKKRIRTVRKVVFIFFLSINALVCICIIDINAKKMLGQDIEIQNTVNNVKLYIEDIVENINNLSQGIKKQINR